MFKLFLLAIVVTGSFVAGDDCWWSGCQPTTWAQKGCFPADKWSQTESKPCGGGDMYRCCPKPGGGGEGTTATTSKSSNSGKQSGGDKAVKETGICSFYGAVGEIPAGFPTASGEPFDRLAMKAAHKTLPFGTKISVKNEDTKQVVTVTINDRGPFTPGRIVDLTFGAFVKVEKEEKGVFKCSYTIV